MVIVPLIQAAFFLISKTLAFLAKVIVSSAVIMDQYTKGCITHTIPKVTELTPKHSNTKTNENSEILFTGSPASNCYVDRASGAARLGCIKSGQTTNSRPPLFWHLGSRSRWHPLNLIPR